MTRPDGTSIAVTFKAGELPPEWIDDVHPDGDAPVSDTGGGRDTLYDGSGVSPLLERFRLAKEMARAAARGLEPEE